MLRVCRAIAKYPGLFGAGTFAGKSYDNLFGEATLFPTPMVPVYGYVASPTRKICPV
jgi:hypothetical protein